MQVRLNLPHTMYAAFISGIHNAKPQLVLGSLAFSLFWPIAVLLTPVWTERLLPSHNTTHHGNLILSHLQSSTLQALSWVPTLASLSDALWPGTYVREALPDPSCFGQSVVSQARKQTRTALFLLWCDQTYGILPLIFSRPAFWLNVCRWGKEKKNSPSWFTDSVYSCASLYFWGLICNK